MMCTSGIAARGAACLAMVVAALGSPRVEAAVLSTSGVVAIDVQEFLDGAPASFSMVETVFPEGMGELPIDASTRVESTDFDELLVAIGQGFAELADAMFLNQSNPEELSLEVACFSNADDVHYSVLGSTIETRTVVFTSPGSTVAPAEITFRSDGTREIESRVFLSGALMIWTSNLDTDDDGVPDGSLENLLAEVEFTVTRSGSDQDAESEILFATSFRVAGGTVSLSDPEVVGPIVHEAITLDELVAGGLDATTAAMLGAIETEGTLTIIAFPSQEHAYRYAVRADEVFELRAEMTGSIRNVPGGSGIALAMGRPFSQLIDFVENALAGSNGESMERTLNAAVAERKIGLVSTGGTGDSGRRFMCGAFGAEMIPMLALAGFVGVSRRRGMSRSRRYAEHGGE